MLKMSELASAEIQAHALTICGYYRPCRCYDKETPKAYYGA